VGLLKIFRAIPILLNFLCEFSEIFEIFIPIRSRGCVKIFIESQFCLKIFQIVLQNCENL